MARVISELPERTHGGQKYQLDRFTDGRAYAVLYGEDYRCTHDGFRASLHRYARLHGLHVDTRKLMEGDEQIGVAFQFSRNGGPT